MSHRNRWIRVALGSIEFSDIESFLGMGFQGQEAGRGQPCEI